ncbi:MAG: hypothetical protein ACHQZQ_05705 [SAR324 cluster bacterium]
MSVSIRGLGGHEPAWQRPGSRHPRQGDAAPGGVPAGAPQADEVTTSPAAGEGDRSGIAAIHQAIQAAEDGLALVSAARHALESVQGRLGRMAGTLRGALERAGPDPPAGPEWAEALSAAQSDGTAIDRLARDARFGGTHLLNGSFGCKGAAFGPLLEFVSAAGTVRSSPPEGYAVLLTQEPTRATLLGEEPLTAQLIAAGETLELEAEGRRVSVVSRPGQSAADVAAALHTEAGLAGLPLGIALTGRDRLLVHHLRYGRKWRFRATSRTPGVLSSRDGSPREAANGRDVAGTLHGEPASGEGQVLVGLPGNRATAGLAVRYTGTTPPGWPPPQARGKAGGAVRDRWKDGTCEAGRVLVVQRALVLHLDGAERSELRLDSVACADLGRGGGTGDDLASVAAALRAAPGQGADALAAVERARAEVGRTLAEALRLERDVLARHLAHLRVEAQNVMAIRGGAERPDDAGHWVAQLGERLRRAGPDALAVQRYPRPTVMLRLLGGEQDGEPGLG